jgi:hypothetical protein
MLLVQKGEGQRLGHEILITFGRNFRMSYGTAFSLNSWLCSIVSLATDDSLLKTSLFARSCLGLVFKRSTISFKNRAGLGLKEKLCVQTFS